MTATDQACLSADTLIAQADQALYYAKTHGRNQSASYLQLADSEEK
ncbi:MAG: hypothetical protein ACRC5U_04385 [Plesiomonas sp.]